jgi:hypothetical protein
MAVGHVRPTLGYESLMPLSGRGGTCATLLFNLATTMVFCRSVNEMIAFYHR